MEVLYHIRSYFLGIFPGMAIDMVSLAGFSSKPTPSSAEVGTSACFATKASMSLVLSSHVAWLPEKFPTVTLVEYQPFFFMAVFSIFSEVLS